LWAYRNASLMNLGPEGMGERDSKKVCKWLALNLENDAVDQTEMES
jgi:hypothetical protein